MIRRQIIARRRSISPSEKHKSSQIIQKTLLARDEVLKASTICLYISLPEEVDTTDVLRNLFEQRKFVVAPQISAKRLILHQIQSADDLIKGRFDIYEPKISCPTVNVSEIDLFIVPGIAFDRKGYRLGWGKGYYDRLLAGVSATKIGLAYSFQIVSRLPHKRYDIPMDIVITEHETLSP